MGTILISLEDDIDKVRWLTWGWWWWWRHRWWLLPKWLYVEDGSFFPGYNEFRGKPHDKLIFQTRYILININER